jgi:sugar lactone lactonase YvrE
MADQSQRPLPRHYVQTAVFGPASSALPIRESLQGLVVDSADGVYVLADKSISILSADHRPIASWRAPVGAACIGVGPDLHILVGSLGRIDVFDTDGSRLAGFSTGEPNRPAEVTAVTAHGQDILVADAGARIVRRHARDGTAKGLIGDQSKTRGFILPNRSLDIAVDPSGVVYATDTGRHQVTMWTIDGAPVGKFGKFGMSDPADFVGCCNPVNLAITAGGQVVTGEKMVARVKVFERDGTLLAVIGPEHFDPACVHIHLAVDSKGRILAGDPVRRTVTVFSPGPPASPGDAP